MDLPTDRDPEIDALLPSVYQRAAPHRHREHGAHAGRQHSAADRIGARGVAAPRRLRQGGLEESRALPGRCSGSDAAHPDRSRATTPHLRHGGDQQRVDIEHIEIPIDTEDDERLLAINAAVEKLTLEHPQIAELVKLRCFVGLEISEAARVLRIPRATAYRRWEFARTWLYKELHA